MTIEWQQAWGLLDDAYQIIDNIGGYLLDIEDEAAENLAGLLPALGAVRDLLHARMTEQEEADAETEAEGEREYQASLDPEDDDEDLDEDDDDEVAS